MAETMRDLFGDVVPVHERRKRRSRRAQAAQAYERMRARGILPIDVLARLLEDAIERGDKGEMFQFASALLPYTSPRLAALAMGPVVPGGALVMGWEDDDNTLDSSAPGAAALQSPVVSEANP